MLVKTAPAGVSKQYPKQALFVAAAEGPSNHPNNRSANPQEE